MLIHAGGGKIEIIIDDKCIIMILKDNGPVLKILIKLWKTVIQLPTSMPVLWDSAKVWDSAVCRNTVMKCTFILKPA